MRTEEETQKAITETEAMLKYQRKKDDYAEIHNTIKVNETATKEILHERKFKKFNTMEYKSSKKNSSIGASKTIFSNYTKN